MAKRTMKEIVGAKYNLTAARERMKMSQPAYSEHIGVSQGTISRWESLETAPQVVQMYNALYLRFVGKKDSKKVKKAKRLAVRTKLGALTPSEKKEEPANEPRTEQTI